MDVDLICLLSNMLVDVYMMFCEIGLYLYSEYLMVLLLYRMSGSLLFECRYWYCSLLEVFLMNLHFSLNGSLVFSFGSNAPLNALDVMDSFEMNNFQFCLYQQCSVEDLTH